jgi:hypothetical protein
MEVEFRAIVTTDANSEWSKKAEFIVLTYGTFRSLPCVCSDAVKVKI